ncbi:MAG: hypothetical protein HYU27_03915 [Acidobacteria bacterium]|nr:hypothetical protein [Acidobacteriota bacterium]
METTTKPAREARATDRVLEALSTLAALLDRSIKEVQALDSDFQNRLLQAVHETESSLQSQAAQHLDAALAAAKKAAAPPASAKPAAPAGAEAVMKEIERPEKRRESGARVLSERHPLRRQRRPQVRASCKMTA